MPHRKTAFALFLGLLLGGCAAVEPMTFEESLNTHRATRNDVRDWDEELRYRVEFQYANTARQKLEKADLEIPPNTNIDIMVPFAIWDYARGDSFGGAMGFASWFSNGLSKESRYAHYFNRGIGYMVNPNTHYFTFDTRPGTATVGDIHQAWDEAFELFQSVYNRDGECHVFGYTEEYQYARTYPKDVPGLHKDVLYLCDHPIFENKKQKVMVMAYANPFDNVRVIAATVTQCYIDPPKGEKFVDVRGCGMRLADAQRPFLTNSRNGWIELAITPTEAAAHELEVVVRSAGEATRLPVPEMTQKYKDFLKSSPY